MKNKLIFLVLTATFLWAYQAMAETKNFTTSESTTNKFRQGESNRTPRERIQFNEQKAEENPSLRNRWDSKSQQPASEGSGVSDNLAQEVLSKFRDDEELSKIPAKLKVSSSSGTVTLNGVVNNDSERSLIEEKVGKMDGVKKVVNQLKIKTSDADLLD